MARPDRRLRWRSAVFAASTIPDSVKVLLLWLAEERYDDPERPGRNTGMNRDGVVSVPRRALAADLGIAPARVSERVKAGRKAGFLDYVRRPTQGVTAVYQATLPGVVWGTENRKRLGTDSVPQSGDLGYATTPPTVTYPSPEDPGQDVPPSAGSSEMTAPHHPSIPDHSSPARPATAGPGEAGTTGTHENAMDGMNDRSKSKATRRPWADLQAAYDNGDIDEGDLEDRLDDLLGGLDDDELRTVTGMLANGAHVKSIFNTIQRDRRVSA